MCCTSTGTAVLQLDSQAFGSVSAALAVSNIVLPMRGLYNPSAVQAYCWLEALL